MPAPLQAGGRSARKAIAVVYDAASGACQKALGTIRAREASLPSPTVELVEWPSKAAEEILAAVGDRLRELNLGEAFCMRGQTVAVLPSGVVLTSCQDDVMQLVAEMEYLSMVQPPLPQTVVQIEQHLAPLRKLRSAGRPGQWWREPGVVSRVADALQGVYFCVLDDFLPAELAETLAGSIRASRPSGSIPVEGRNGWTRGGTARAAEAIHSEGDFETRNERLAKALMSPSRGDVLRFSDGEEGMPGTQGLFDAVDDLVMGLKQCPQVAERLQTTDFANSAMFTVYPGGAARYIKHTDNSLLTDGRRLTTILYLNRAWEPSHGGQLRIFDPTMQSMRTKMDVEPLWNRLVVFWSTEEVPHEVLPSYQDRAAVSLWYCCARECLQTEEAFKRLVSKVRCVGGQERASRLAAAGTSEEQRRLLRTLGGAGDPQERRAVLAAVEHDFEGCEAHRQQRARLNQLFGWDAWAAEVQRQIFEAQMKHLEMFQAMGLSAPAGLEVKADVRSSQTSAPAFTEAFCRRTDREREVSHPAGAPPEARAPGVAGAAGRPAERRPHACGLPLGSLPLVYEAVD